MKYRIILPVVYLVASVVLVVGFGRAGHGSGGEMFYYVSLPAGAISIAVEKSLKSGEAALFSWFFAGVFQYLLLGYLIDLWVRRRRTEKL